MFSHFNNGWLKDKGALARVPWIKLHWNNRSVVACWYRFIERKLVALVGLEAVREGGKQADNM